MLGHRKLSTIPTQVVKGYNRQLITIHNQQERQLYVEMGPIVLVEADGEHAHIMEVLRVGCNLLIDEECLQLHC